MAWSSHLLIVPILLPLLTGASLLLIDEIRHKTKAGINLAATLLYLLAALALMWIADAAPEGRDAVSTIYALGDWPIPFAIVLVLDRLAALMLVLSAVLAMAALIFSMARWHRMGPHFHTLFQFLLMGLGGAFLTGDLFNLFVFFEVTLAASYGLLLHGSGTMRVRWGLHYIAINLAASFLFLIGVSLIYGVTGTLNMADLAARLAGLGGQDRMLLQAGAAILGIAFLVKAAMWPLGFWLPQAYQAAAAPVAAVFVVLTKVGIYSLLRLTLLLFGDEQLSGFGSGVLLWGGLATLGFGIVGMLAAQSMGRFAGFSVLVSSGTILAALGIGGTGVVSGALFYLVSSTLTTGAFFLLIELVERARQPGADLLAVTMEAFGETPEPEDEEESEFEEVGVIMPKALAVLAICFGCVALLLAGLPPLSGFVAKFAILSAALDAGGTGSAIAAPAWLLLGFVILSGLAALVALMRIGIRTFWGPLEMIVPRVLVVEVAPVIGLLAFCLALTVGAGGMLRYTEATAMSLHNPLGYVQGVLGTEWGAR